MFLEKVCGVLSDNYEKESLLPMILLDKGVESTYIVYNMVQQLNLQCKKSHNVKINGFRETAETGVRFPVSPLIHISVEL